MKDVEKQQKEIILFTENCKFFLGHFSKLFQIIFKVAFYAITKDCSDLQENIG